MIKNHSNQVFPKTSLFQTKSLAPRQKAQGYNPSFIYRYKIYPPHQLPESKRAKGRALVHTPILKYVLANDPEWREVAGRSHHYADWDTESPIKNFFQTKTKITGKIFLARLMRNYPFYPPTIVFHQGGKLDPLTDVNRAYYRQNELGQWYLKPDGGRAGRGIKILSHPKEASKIVAKTKGSYVLQKGVEQLMLYQGHKFDIRVWVLINFNRDRFRAYIYRNGELRLSSFNYRPSSKSAVVNLTNGAVQMHQRSEGGLYKGYCWQDQSFYTDSYRQIRGHVLDTVNELRRFFRATDQSGFELIGFDFVLGQSGAAYLLEINRYLGYPMTPRRNYPDSVREMVYQMFQDTLNLAVKPFINPSAPHRPGQWDFLTCWGV